MLKTGAQGIAEDKAAIAKKMLNKGMDINLISELTNLTISEINCLR